MLMTHIIMMLLSKKMKIMEIMKTMTHVLRTVNTCLHGSVLQPLLCSLINIAPIVQPIQCRPMQPHPIIATPMCSTLIPCPVTASPTLQPLQSMVQHMKCSPMQRHPISVPQQWSPYKPRSANQCSTPSKASAAPLVPSLLLQQCSPYSPAWCSK